MLYYRKGSLQYLYDQSQFYDDIINIVKQDCKIIILCRKNYDIDSVRDFIYYYVPVDIECEIKAVEDD